MNLRPETEARLTELAVAAGVSVDELLAALVEKRELPVEPSDVPEAGSGMVEENGLRVYRTGKPLSAHVVDDLIRQSRDERSRHLLGDFA